MSQFLISTTPPPPASVHSKQVQDYSGASLIWTSEIRTLPYSGHLMWSQMLHLRVNKSLKSGHLGTPDPSNQDTSTKWTPEMVPRVSELERFHCIPSITQYKTHKLVKLYIAHVQYNICSIVLPTSREFICSTTYHAQTYPLLWYACVYCVNQKLSSNGISQKRTWSMIMQCCDCLHPPL